MALRIAFMGTPEFSVPVLRALHDAEHNVVAVYSQPPRPAGRRGLELTPSPVEQAARSLGLPVHTPKSLKSAEEQQRFADLDLDVAVVVAYGLCYQRLFLMHRVMVVLTGMHRYCPVGVVQRPFNALLWLVIKPPA